MRQYHRLSKSGVQDWLTAARLTVIVGHFGSGKTEVSLNLARALAGRGLPFSLADLDVVDPYFRSRECRARLESWGGRLIASSQACLDADVPSMPPDVMALFDDESRYGILDVGGDASGARVLARYSRRLRAAGARVLCVVNANRPLTDTPEKTVSYIRGIEQAAKIPVDGLINNTHLCDLSDSSDAMKGAEMAKEVSRMTGLPIVCHAVAEELAPEAKLFLSPVFPLELYLKKPWEQGA